MAIYYNYNNVYFKINGQSLLVDSADFSVNPELSEKMEADKRGGFDRVAGSGLQTSLSLNYFLVGADPIRPFLGSENPIPFEAAGLTLQKGYLTSYSINASPFGSVMVSVTIQFFEDFGGSFSPATLPEQDNKYLKFSDMSVTLQGIDASSKIQSLNYSLSQSVDPQYNVEGLVPNDVRFGKRASALEMDTYNFQEALPFNGKNVVVDFSIGDEEYQVGGILAAKSIKFAFGQKISANLSIETSSYGKAPSLHASNTGGSLKAGDLWNIYGDNLLDTTTIYFNNNIKVNEFTVLPTSGSDLPLGDSYIKITVPRFARSGPIRVITPHGEATHEQIAGMAPIDANISAANQIFVP
jgi:hypothetical protein